MSNLIQIKRSLNTAAPASLANGELAYTANGDTLAIGSNGSIVYIAGKRFPGVLTANQALVANSLSMIDTVRASNVVVTNLSANGSYGTNGQILVSNGTAAYWTTTLGGISATSFNTTGVLVDNTGVYASSNTLGFNLGNTTSRFVLNSNTINSSGLITGSSGINITGSVNATSTVYVGANVYMNTTSISAGNSTVNAYINSSLLSITNSTSSANLGAGVLTVGTSVVNTTAISVGDLVVNGNTTIGSNTQDLITFNALVSGNLIPSTNNTSWLGNNSLRFAEIHAGNVHSQSGYFDGDVQIAGNLTVTGSSLTVNVATLTVTDALIQLGSNNTTSDLLDIGFFGNYNDAAIAPHEHAGLFRDASDSGIFKLFTNLTEAPTTTVNTAATSYIQGTMQSYLLSSALVTNSSVTNITANSTVAVTITANTLYLSNALQGNSGGTGLLSYTQEDIIVANSTNGFRKLGLGSDGFVLQSNGTALLYNSLDGGSF
ncbi:hypothetical protein UFOVP247_126 [uncultured Caudovirales phage]|uniref:Uncharacterized protein n=1 Tax=uncultured Caudovirales phage TaxID=2100421 RepID=A0A6J7WU35_9CAUD|nr:hypothetical protein UFOVP247_126 [uncultured Caudovirales phage]